MNKFRLVLIAICLTLAASAQHNDINFKAGSGLFYFTGNGSAGQQPAPRTLYYGNPNPNAYGDRPGFSLTAAAVFKRATKSNFLLGIGTEFQKLDARAHYDIAYATPSATSSYMIQVEVNGETEYSIKFLSLMPFAGWRFRLGTKSLDIMAGPEIAWRLSGSEHISVKGETNYSFEGSRKVEGKKTDIRLQAQAELNFNRIIVSAGYARGLTNYYGILVGGPQKEAYSNFVRLGVGWRMK